jgi:hypothetical protein
MAALSAISPNGSYVVVWEWENRPNRYVFVRLFFGVHLLQGDSRRATDPKPSPNKVEFYLGTVWSSLGIK